jgi:hypothetical protein
VQINAVNIISFFFVAEQTLLHASSGAGMFLESQSRYLAMKDIFSPGIVCSSFGFFVSEAGCTT